MAALASLLMRLSVLWGSEEEERKTNMSSSQVIRGSKDPSGRVACACNHLLPPRSPCRLELRSGLGEAARRRRRRSRLDSQMQTSLTYVHRFLECFLLTSASGLPFRYQTNSRTPAKQRAKKKRAPISFHILPEEDFFSTKTTLLWSRPISALLSEVVYSTILRSHF